MAEALIDLSDLLPEEMQAEGRKRLTQGKRKPIAKKEIARKLRTKPFPEPTYPKGFCPVPGPEPVRQVVFYDFYSCKCGRAWHVPRWGAQTFNHIVDTRSKSHYTPATSSDDLPHSIEMITHSVHCCPSCWATPSNDPTIQRMFHSHDPAPLTKQASLDFDDPACGYILPASHYPLVISGELRQGVL